MNIEMLKAGGIEFEEGLERFSGNEELYVKYLKKFLSLDTYGQMRELVLKGELQGAFEAAHKLKAFTGNLSVGLFYEHIKALTEDLRAGAIKDYRPVIEKLDEEHKMLLQAIRSIDDAN